MAYTKIEDLPEITELSPTEELIIQTPTGTKRIKANLLKDEELAQKVNELDSSLNDKVGNFTSGNYKAVTGLAYDSLNNRLGLKVGADTVIPFSKGEYKTLKVGSGAYYNATFDVAKLLPDIYQDLTADNFFFKNMSVEGWKSGGVGFTTYSSISYDALTGQVNVTPPMSNNGGGASSGYQGAMASFEIWVAYIDQNSSGSVIKQKPLTIKMSASGDYSGNAGTALWLSVNTNTAMNISLTGYSKVTVKSGKFTVGGVDYTEGEVDVTDFSHGTLTLTTNVYASGENPISGTFTHDVGAEIDLE